MAIEARRQFGQREMGMCRGQLEASVFMQDEEDSSNCMQAFSILTLSDTAQTARHGTLQREMGRWVSVPYKLCIGKLLSLNSVNNGCISCFIIFIWCWCNFCFKSILILVNGLQRMRISLSSEVILSARAAPSVISSFNYACKLFQLHFYPMNRTMTW